MSPTGGPAPPSSFRLLRALRVGAEQGAGQDCSGSASSRCSRRRGRARHVGVAKWAWSAGGGAGLWDPGSPRTLQELPPPQPAPLRSHRFLSRDLDSAAMSATEEVDGLGVSRPHYGCEWWAPRRGGFGVGLCVSGAPFSRGSAGRVGQGGCGPRGPGRAGVAEGGVAGGEAPSPRVRVSEAAGVVRRRPPRFSWGAAAGGPHPAPPAAQLDRDLGGRPRVRWQEDGAGRVPGNRDGRRGSARAW